MYLAAIPEKQWHRFVIRESYWDRGCFRSRDLVDLGSDPSQYIVYPGGRAYYVDPDLEDQIRDQGGDPDPDALAAAAGMELLLKEYFKLRGQIIFTGQVSRAENRELLGKLRRVEALHHHTKGVAIRLGRPDLVGGSLQLRSGHHLHGLRDLLRIIDGLDPPSDFLGALHVLLSSVSEPGVSCSRESPGTGFSAGCA